MPPRIGLVCPLMLDWIEIWGILEVKSTYETCCCAPQNIPELVLLCGRIILLKEATGTMDFPWKGEHCLQQCFGRWYVPEEPEWRHAAGRRPEDHTSSASLPSSQSAPWCSLLCWTIFDRYQVLQTGSRFCSLLAITSWISSSSLTSSHFFTFSYRSTLRIKCWFAP